MEINEILAASSYFLKVYELKKKLDTWAWKLQKQTVVRQLSSCITEKFNGFNIISIEYGKKSRRKFKLIDIIYKPVKKADAEIKCCF